MFLRTLDPARRDELLLRLSAFADMEEGASTRVASEAANVSLPTMFRLKRIWKETQDLRSVAGLTARPKRGASKTEIFREARKIAARLAEEPDNGKLSIKAFAREISEAVGGKISINGASTIAREIRQESRTSPDALVKNYGREIILDACAVSLSIKLPHEDPQLAIMALITEQASGLILAARVATENTAGKAQLEAIDAARKFLANEKADVRLDRPTILYAAVAPAVDAIARALGWQLTRIFGAEQVDQKSPRRFGRRTIRLIGPAIGRLRLLPGSTEGGKVSAAAVRAAGRIPMSRDQAQSFVDMTVKEHNAPIIEKLRKGLIIPPPETAFIAGSMDDVLSKMNPPPSRSQRIML